MLGMSGPRSGRFIAGLVLLGAPPALAQVPYGSTSQIALYSPLTVGQAVPLVFDTDDGHALLPLGFEFEHYGVLYDHVTVSVNGALNFVNPCALGCGFDEVCSAAAVCTRSPLEPYPYNPPGFPSAQPPNRVVAAFWDDLVFDTLSAPFSSMRYATLGSAPNRRFVVEWSNLRRLVGTGPGTARVSFQIELHEGTDHIILHYGPTVAGTGSWSGYVGLENATGTEAYSPVICGDVNPGCDFAALSSLSERRYTLFVPDLPELAAVSSPPTGGLPGTTFSLPFEVSNVGRQGVNAAFSVEAYLSIDLVIDASDVFLGGVRVEDPIPRGGARGAVIDALIPSDLPIGTYRLGLLLDPQDEVIEGDESNNAVLHSQSFLVGAELSVRFSALAPMAPGETEPLSVFILNAGAAQPEVGYAVYFSSDRSLDAQDGLLAAGVTAIGAVPETELLLSVPVPSVSPGRYYLIAEVDTADQIPEVNETNNRVVSAAFPVGPDFRLAVDGPSVTGAGSPETFSLTLRNDGSAAPPVEWRILLGRGQAPGPGDLVIREGTANLTGLQTLSLTVTATIPSDALGTYTVMAVVDPNDLIAEVDESNNLAVLTRTTVVEGPDLWARRVQGAPVGFAGQPYAVEVELRNRGRTATPEFFYSLHLSTNRVITLSDPLLAEFGPLRLAAGEVMTRRWVVDLPASVPRGPYALGLIADWTTLVVEDDETNNIAVFPPSEGFITIRDPAPDFSVSRVLGPVAAAAGELFTAVRTLENRGNAAGTLRYEVYLARGTQLDESSRWLGADTRALGALEQETGVDVLRAPSDLEAAQYYLIYRLDPADLVDELDESNNQRASDGALTLEPGVLQIVNTELPVATQSQPYEWALGARGGTGAYRWSSVGGPLPDGLSLDAAGFIAGQSESLGAHPLRFRVEDGLASAERDFVLLVAEVTTELELATRSLPPVWLGRPFRYELLALGGVPPLVFSVESTLPEGLELSAAGLLSGIAYARHDEVFSFRVRDAAGRVASRLMALRVVTVAESLRFGLLDLPDGLVGRAYHAPLAAEFGAPPYTFERVEGALPEGLRLEDGALRGVPSRVQRASFRLQVRDARGDQASASYVVEIEPSGQIGYLSTALPVARVGAPYQAEDGRAVRIRALSSSGTGTVTYALAAGALPPGLSLEHTGRVFGTPERAGLFSFAALARDDGDTQAVRAFGVLVEDPNARLDDAATGACGCRQTSSPQRAPPWLGLLLLAGLLARARRARRAVPLGLALSILLPAEPASAQHGYVFEEEPFTYQPRVGGSVLSFTNEDDGQVTVSLPFSFSLLGRVHSELTVSTNGYVSFDGAGLAYSNDEIPSPRAPNALLAPFWDDLVVSPGSVRTFVDGRAPARVFVLQYAALRRFRSFGASFALQLLLYEGAAGRFEFRYAPAFGLTPEEPFSASIGLEAAGGLQGVVLRDCTPGCGAAALESLGNRRIRGHGPGALDLLTTRIEPPTQAVVEVPFVVVLGLRSEHAAPLGPVSYRVYLSSPFELEPTRVLHEAQVSLEPFEDRSLSVPLTIGSSVAPGRYRLALELDPEGALAEVDRSNNLLYAELELELSPPAADLVALDVLGAPSALRAGEPLQIVAHATNRGRVAADFEWSLSLTANRVVSADDPVLARAWLRLAPGETATISATPVVPSETPGGRYFLGLSLDPENRVREENEHNNRRASEQAVTVDAGGLSITTQRLPRAARGLDYLGFLQAFGGDGQYLWRVVSGSVPEGLGLLASSGELRGRPTTVGAYTFEVEVTSAGATARRGFELEVVEPTGGLAIVTRNLPIGFVAEPYPRLDAGAARVQVAGARGPVRIELTGAAPPGLALGSDGVLSGVPAAVGDYVLEVTARDDEAEASRLIPLTIAAPGRLTLISRALPAATLDEAYQAPLEVLGAIPGSTLSFSILGGSGLLPPGLALTPEGLLVGVPERTGVWSFVGEVYEQAEFTTDFDAALYFLEVSAPEGFAITPSSLPPARVGERYEVGLAAVEGRPPYAWRTVGEAMLPPGLLFVVDHRGEAQTLLIEGTPREVPDAPGGVVSFLLEVTDAQGRRAEQPLSLRVFAVGEGLGPADAGCDCRASSTAGAASTHLIFLLAWLFRRRRAAVVG